MAKQFARREKTMDCVTMKLMERDTGLPLDLVVLINTLLLCSQEFFDDKLKKYA
jgi:hypothetical protein